MSAVTSKTFNSQAVTGLFDDLEQACGSKVGLYDQRARLYLATEHEYSGLTCLLERYAESSLPGKWHDIWPVLIYSQGTGPLDSRIKIGC